MGWSGRQGCGRIAVASLICMWKFTVEFDLHRLNPNKRLHWRARWKLDNVLKQAVNFAWLQQGAVSLAGKKIAYELVVYRARRVDDDNLIAACKAGRDELFRLCDIKSDSPLWVRILRVEQKPGKEWRGKERFDIIVYEDK